jgi:multidrug efflux pump subunit AcrA (membrane-fusion protein)
MKIFAGWLALVLLVTLAVSADGRGKPDDDDTPAHAAPPAADTLHRAAADKDDKDDKQDEQEKDGKTARSGAKDDDNRSAPLSLTAAQQDAVGIRSERALPLSAAPPIDGYVSVLDPAELVTDLGHMESSEAIAAAAVAEAARTQRLYHEEAQASLKASQAAQAQATEAEAQARAASISFRLQWGPVAQLGSEARHKLVEDLTAGRTVLLRADVPGQHLGMRIEPRALVEVDGINVAVEVLGPLPRTSGSSQSAGWLLEIAHAPSGLGPGMRGLAHLRSAADLRGLLIPASAILYSADGAYVYRQEPGGGAASRYTAVPVRLLTRVGSAWLVGGLTNTDTVVTQGAGVLWSLQGISSFSAAEEDHD